MDEQQAERVGDWVRRAREARRWSQSDLAHHSRVSDETLSKIENHKVGARGPQMKTLAKLERGLEVPPGTLDRVAAGEDVPVEAMGMPTSDDDEMIVSLISGLRQSLSRMEDRLDDLETRVDDLGPRDGPRPPQP